MKFIKLCSDSKWDWYFIISDNSCERNCGNKEQVDGWPLRTSPSIMKRYAGVCGQCLVKDFESEYPEVIKVFREFCNENPDVILETS